MKARILPLTGVENFRDYGGYAGAGGRRVAAGQLYRSAHHGKATADDLDAIGALNLAAVVDLRRPMERDAEPTPRPQGFAGRVIECDLGDRAEAPHVAFLRETDLTPQSARAFFLDYYTHAPYEERHLVLFRRYFEALGEVDGPVLIHCTAGKDRTGLLAALTHTVLGVHRDDILADYLLTNQAARLEDRAPTVAENLEKLLGKRPSDVAVRAFLGVEAGFLERALQAIAERSGSVDAYLAEIGVDAAAAQRLRERLLV